MQLTTTQGGNLTTWAADINAAHHAAMRHAVDAVAYAAQAGALLMKAKQKLPHGEFGNWLQKNCQVSERQARRYMAAAQGKPTPVRAIAAPVKTDTVSDLPAPPKTLHDYFRPSWIPMKGYTYSAANDDGAYWVAHSKEHPGYFHVSHLTEETYSGTRRPVAGISVEYMLQGYGLLVPADADWEVLKSFDMSRPFGEPEELLAEWKAKRFVVDVPHALCQ